MKSRNRYRNRILSLLLVMGLTFSTVFIPGALAEESNTEVEQEKETNDIQDEDSASEHQSNTVAQENIEAQADGSTADQNGLTGNGTGTETVQDDTSGDAATVSTAEDLPLKITSVTFDGQQLKEEQRNEITDSWTGDKSRIVEIKVNKNLQVQPENGKKYILCLKVSDVFYFNGIPDKSKITGVEDIAFIKNPTPKVNVSGGGQGNLSTFSNYSGEIRMELNPSVEMITVTDLGISFNEQLAGYAGGSQTVKDPFQVSLIAVDESKDLDGITEEDEQICQNIKLDSVVLTSGSLAGGGLKNAISTDGFATAILAQSVKIGKDNGVSYYGGTSGESYQVYKTLKVVFHCPYITVNGQKYYLKFSESDMALSQNKQGSAKGYLMAGPVVYDEREHTLTYSFENIYIGSHQALFYTPIFTWPEDEAIKDFVIASGNEYKIEGCNWEVKDQTNYTGSPSTLRSSYTPSNAAYYIADQVNVTMTSSAEADPKLSIAKREIYQGITRENGVTGTLGFFDIHNDGAVDSPLLNIKYEFNTGNKDAVYYVTQVNLAAYNNKSGTDVTYVLSNGKDEKSGVKHYSNQSTFVCQVGTLRTDCGADSSYHIKSLSYQTMLQKGAKYHIETAHLNRNRINDSGLFFGYIEGDLGKEAEAVMTISAVDPSNSITEDGKPEISSTEKSKISDQDYIGYSLTKMSFSGADSKAITAGDSATLQFGGNISTEEFARSGTKVVNGYHVFRDGVFYICLPDGVSIPGKEQVQVTVGSRNVAITDVKKLTETAGEIDGTSACWWMIEADKMNVTGGANFTVSVQLATDMKMKGIVWNFQKNVMVRAKGQSISWNAAGSLGNAYDKLSDLKTISTLSSLTAYLEKNGETTGLGSNLYNTSANVKLNIARAEAKLDVESSLESETAKRGDEIQVEAADEELDYRVIISSNDGGRADDFSYYIPVVSKTSRLDPGAFVIKNEFGLSLQEQIRITQLSTGENETGNEDLFEVYYTEEAGLDSVSIRQDSVTWSQSAADYSKVTAIKIITKENAFIDTGASYEFAMKLKYDNTNADFDKMAGSIVQWRTFGHYTYNRSGTETTNTYPSADNTIVVNCKKDFSSDTMNAVLKTDATENKVSVDKNLEQSYIKDQQIRIKKVSASTGTQLIDYDPKDLTGANANNKFRINLKLNDGTAVTLSESGSKATWTLRADHELTVSADIFYSKALTDSTTVRFIDVTLGNEYIDLTVRIQLIREVAKADATASGVVAGRNYQVPQVAAECEISQDSSFTALFVVGFYKPGNHESQEIRWRDQDEKEVNLPENAEITLMQISETNDVESYWYYKADGSKSTVDLKEFCRMGGTEHFQYSTTGNDDETLRYLLVIDFEECHVSAGEYQIAFSASSGASTEVYSSPAVKIKSKTTYGVQCQSEDGTLGANATVQYITSPSEGNDSYSEGKTLALVLTPDKAAELPYDVRIQCEDKEYVKNSQGKFIVPIGTIKSSGTKKLTLVSDLFPNEEKSYSFTVQLMLALSADSEMPMNGVEEAGNEKITFVKKASETPSLKASGKHIGTSAEWAEGLALSLAMEKIPANGTVTVTAYSGITGTQKVTDLLSSVSGVFTLQDGSGTYDSSKSETGKLVLSGSAAAGTYRLSFEVNDGDGNTVLEVPYYIIVK